MNFFLGELYFQLSAKLSISVKVPLRTTSKPVVDKKTPCARYCQLHHANEPGKKKPECG